MATLTRVPSGSVSLANARPKKSYPTDQEAYRLLEEVGEGVSAKVWRAQCVPFNEVVAIKVLDLEKLEPSSLNEIVRETQTMSQLNHPNLVTYHCSFVAGQSLWVIMPFLAGGSVLNLMKWSFPQGLEEAVIATVIKEVLKALDYFHRSGNIHRDVKAGNILVDTHGNVKLADFGVAASCWGSGGTWKPHQTFVGTPCWMAPEVMEQVKGYDFHADIWSLGITILELAYGHAPFSKYPPMKVLMLTLQNPPPGLEDTGTRHFSKSLRDLAAVCLQKDPSKRPSASKLLEHRFLKEARKPDYLVKNLLDGIPSLPERAAMLKERAAAAKAPPPAVEQPAERLAVPSASLQQQQQPAHEVQRGVSNWNFDVEALKAEGLATEAAEAAKTAASAAAQPAAGATGAQQPAAIATGGEGSRRVESISRSPREGQAKKNVEHRGRFQVYKDDDDLEGESPPPQNAVRRGRFSVVEDSAADAASKQFTTQQQQQSKSPSLLPQLQALMAQSAQQQEAIKALIAAQDGKGGSAALPRVGSSGLIVQGMSTNEKRRELPPEQHPAAVACAEASRQVVALADENHRLKRRVAELERELAALKARSPVVSPTHSRAPTRSLDSE